jgi:hypothetical protein
MKRTLALCVCTLLLQKAFVQSAFPLPPIDTLHNSVDQYYASLTIAQAEELKEQRKNRWMNYVPNPGYSPFAGGFTLSLNLAAPLTEIKLKQQARQKVQSIERMNQLQARQLKNEITGDYRAIQHAIAEYHSKDSLCQLKQKAFNLFSSQYQRNELTPSEFLSRQQEYEVFKTSRISEANAIHRSILGLLIKAKAAIAANDDGF